MTLLSTKHCGCRTVLGAVVVVEGWTWIFREASRLLLQGLISTVKPCKLGLDNLGRLLKDPVSGSRGLRVSGRSL